MSGISLEASARGYLVRGLDPIPDNWEGASAHRALQSLRRAETALVRVIGGAVAAGDRARARDLQGVLTAVERGFAHISGAFVIRDIAPVAKKRAGAVRKAKRRCAKRQAARQPRLVVDNTRGASP